MARAPGARTHSYTPNLEREVRAESHAPLGAGERPEFPAGAPAGTTGISLCGAHP